MNAAGAKVSPASKKAALVSKKAVVKPDTNALIQQLITNVKALLNDGNDLFAKAQSDQFDKHLEYLKKCNDQLSNNSAKQICFVAPPLSGKSMIVNLLSSNMKEKPFPSSADKSIDQLTKFHQKISFDETFSVQLKLASGDESGNLFPQSAHVNKFEVLHNFLQTLHLNLPQGIFEKDVKYIVVKGPFEGLKKSQNITLVDMVGFSDNGFDWTLPMESDVIMFFGGRSCSANMLADAICATSERDKLPLFLSSCFSENLQEKCNAILPW